MAVFLPSPVRFPAEWQLRLVQHTAVEVDEDWLGESEEWRLRPVLHTAAETGEE